MSDRGVLHLVVCAAPPVDRIGELVDLLMADGWTVCLIATPVAASWLDRGGDAGTDRLSGTGAVAQTR
ncbi:hypothetical protein GA0070216_101417 [Micromonospora matsumotoense]|uniref:Uncharacterized protein n=1 Tax=Micromonospora matsumotoense TaxID=121616 RepID=A0A1C4UD59_9ACTN|nr:hypothetical protein [Micromonospora matsumotoense]SCE69613.1 hypothetical protein GA0070216_101417 [Micromonospora matsumotoense]